MLILFKKIRLAPATDHNLLNLKYRALSPPAARINLLNSSFPDRNSYHYLHGSTALPLEVWRRCV